MKSSCFGALAFPFGVLFVGGLGSGDMGFLWIGMSLVYWASRRAFPNRCISPNFAGRSRSLIGRVSGITEVTATSSTCDKVVCPCPCPGAVHGIQLWGSPRHSGTFCHFSVQQGLAPVHSTTMTELRYDAAQWNVVLREGVCDVYSRLNNAAWNLCHHRHWKPWTRTQSTQCCVLPWTSVSTTFHCAAS